jgi:toxin ParE1/3/4
VVRFRFSRRAETDLLAIGEYTLRTWGETQAARYLDDIGHCCQMLAANPGLGRVCDYIRPGLRRHEHGKHVIFFRSERGGFSFPASFINACSRSATQSTIPKKNCSGKLLASLCNTALPFPAVN